MKSVAAAAIVIWLAAGSAFAQVRDQRVTPIVPPPAGTASIAGSVVAADDGHPLAVAHVVAIGALTGTLKLTTTDRNGQFSFANLPADRYVVAASKLPYIGAVAGARRAARPGTPIVIANDQKLSGVRVALPRGAVIAGMILDDLGKPVPNATVLLRQWKMQGDERVLASPTGTSAASADAAGRYRLYGIPPGEYLVSAIRPQAIPVRAVTDKEIDQLLDGKPVDLTVDSALRSVASFYPGTTRPQEATPVVVNSGDQRLGVDFAVGFVRAARVEGTVVGPDGQPVNSPNLFVQMAMNDGVFRGSMVARTQPDGRFAFAPSIPGTQLLTVGGANGLVGVASIDTTAGDQIGVQITLRTVSVIAGQLNFDGVSPPALGGRLVSVRTFGPSADLGPGITISPTVENGTFKIGFAMPGRYLIGGSLSNGAAGDGLAWTLKSVMADDKDITDKVLTIGADPAPASVTVTYTDQWQRLSGKLSHQSGAAATDETVIVFPADRAYWYQGSRRIATSRPGSDGLFSFGGPGVTSLPPGDYLMAAVVDLGRDEQFDPSLLATLVPAAAPITIGPGEKKIQDLVIR